MQKARLKKVEAALLPVGDPPTDEDLAPALEHMRALNEVYNVQQTDAEILADLRATYRKWGVSGAAVRQINAKVEAGLEKIYGPGGPGYDDADDVAPGPRPEV
jgi:hypothetical protein